MRSLLSSQPAFCEITTRSFDKELPEIDSYTEADGEILSFIACVLL